jgi:adenylosuccinate synthase
VALKYAAEINGFTGLALMKADILNDFRDIRVCVAYELDGKTLDELPSCVEDLERVKPVYRTLPGWKSYDAKRVHARKDLPQEMQSFLAIVEDAIGIPIVLLSTGPGREETLEF